MLNIAVVMGGYSDESVISLKSGKLIYDSLDEKKYNKYEVHILMNEWYVLDKTGEKLILNKSNFSFEKEGQSIFFDAVFNIIHGTPGEDGHLQAYWELLGVKYTGCSFYHSALTFNKRDTLSVLSKFEVLKAESLYFSMGDDIIFDDIVKKLKLPFFVKPNQSGSSLGVSKVSEEKEFSEAIQKAYNEDKDILIESFLEGREFSIGVIEYKNEVIALGITEIISENEFFDYDAKYNGKSQEITPANIEEEMHSKLIQQAIFIYKKIGMKGFSRLDFIWKDNNPYFIEINTNPGMSPQSIFPQQVEHSPFTLTELLDNEINNALQRKNTWKK